MKRVIAFDFLRGVAIIVVLMLHTFQLSYVNRLRGLLDEMQAGSLPVGWYFFLAPVYVLGSSNGLFLMLSCASNGISVAKQWRRKVDRDSIDPAAAFKSIMKSQVVRGGIIYFCGWVSEGICASSLEYMLSSIHGGDEPYSSFFIKGLFWTNILHGIGESLVLSSLIQLLYLWKGTSRRRFVIICLAISLGVCGLTPVMQLFTLATVGTQSFAWDNLFEATPGNIVGRLLLLPFTGRIIPLFPFFSGAMIGLIYATFISEDAVKRPFFRRMHLLALMMILLGAGFGAAMGDLNLDDRARNAPWHMILVGWETFCLGILIFLIDFRDIDQKKFLARTVFIRRYGIMTLTLWMLQYAIVGPALLLELLTGWAIVGLDGAGSYGLLNDWQVWILVAIVFIIFSTLLWLWEKVNFAGSFEWMSARLLSGRHTSGDRLNLAKVLYDSESVLQADEVTAEQLQKVSVTPSQSQSAEEDVADDDTRLLSVRSGSGRYGTAGTSAVPPSSSPASVPAASGAARTGKE